MPDFSVIITTRNRPELFEAALQSVLCQTDVALEVVVINDGSEDRYRDSYNALEEKYKSSSGRVTVRFINLISSLRGHGPSYALNQGALHACAPYLAFLDDDDSWTCNTHLSTALSAIRSQDENVDLYLSLQKAWKDNAPVQAPQWLEHNVKALTRVPIDIEHVYRASAPDCMANGVFAHVNTLIIRREYFFSIPGFDEDVRYESDRQFFLQAIDGTDSILFTDQYISRHNIPDKKVKKNITTEMDYINKMQYNLVSFNKLHMFSKRKIIRDYAKISYGYTLGHIAEEYEKMRNYRAARYYAGLALMGHFSIGAAVYYIYVAANGLFRSGVPKP